MSKRESVSLGSDRRRRRRRCRSQRCRGRRTDAAAAVADAGDAHNHTSDGRTDRRTEGEARVRRGGGQRRPAVFVFVRRLSPSLSLFLFECSKTAADVFWTGSLARPPPLSFSLSSSPSLPVSLLSSLFSSLCFPSLLSPPPASALPPPSPPPRLPSFQTLRAAAPHPPSVRAGPGGPTVCLLTVIVKRAGEGAENTRTAPHARRAQQQQRRCRRCRGRRPSGKAGGGSDSERRRTTH